VYRVSSAESADLRRYLLYAQATTEADRDAADKVGALLFRRPEAGTPDDGRESRAPWTRHEAGNAAPRRPRRRRSPAQTLEPGVGIEPTTSSLQEKCSTD
jgi:hypothetical protein